MKATKTVYYETGAHDDITYLTKSARKRAIAKDCLGYIEIYGFCPRYNFRGEYPDAVFLQALRKMGWQYPEKVVF